jgi:hypothetical protein
VAWVDGGGEARHMRDVPRDRVRALFRRVAAGDLGALDAQLWLPGYG